MPQIAQLGETYASQIFWILVIFGLVFIVIGNGMVPKVMATVALRDKQIGDDLAAAEATRKAADSEEASWRARENENRAKAQAIIAAAKGEAARAAESRLAEVAVRLDAQLAEADVRIGAARDNALSEIETVATEAAGTIVSRLVGVTVDEAAARVAVKEVLHG